MFIKRSIYEYDIYKANISCLLEMGEINQEQYNMLKDIPKDERAKFVAAFEKLEADTSKGYHIFVEKSLEKFKKLNNIEKENIIEIAFDAIWIDKEVNNLEITENIRFTCKRKASSILEIRKVKFYFNSMDNTFFQRGLGKKESPWSAIQQGLFLFRSEVHRFHLLRCIVAIVLELPQLVVKTAFAEQFIEVTWVVVIANSFVAETSIIIRTEQV